MFDFQNLEVYKKAKVQHKSISLIIKNNTIDKNSQNQLFRASSSIVLNIAEGTGRFTNADKRNFYIIARGSVFECVALLEILQESQTINSSDYQVNLERYEELSKMLFGLIKSLE